MRKAINGKNIDIKNMTLSHRLDSMPFIAPQQLYCQG